METMSIQRIIKEAVVWLAGVLVGLVDDAFAYRAAKKANPKASYDFASAARRAIRAGVALRVMAETQGVFASE